MIRPNNLYIVVEGEKTEPAIYRAWLPYLFSGITEVKQPNQAIRNHFYLVEGNGYPSYEARIEDAIKDLRDMPNFDALVVAVDAEDLTFQERINALNQAAQNCPVEFCPVVADCCIETWFLGRRKMIGDDPGPALQKYLEFYDVRDRDPERMPMDPGAKRRTRAQYHQDYFCQVFKHKLRRNYNKSAPHPEICEHHYWLDLQRRAEDTGHLQSFATLLSLPQKLRWASNI